MKDDQRQKARLKELERRAAAAGLPVTVQRRAALPAPRTRRDHPTADAIYGDVVTELPGVSKATVYRALDNLVELGLARRVHHEGSIARYDGNEERHHHLVCESCGSITDVEWEALDAIPIPKFSNRAFEVRDFFVNFQGLCRDCAATESSVRRKK
jgi:Fe2+ or Zn2+ uptake regulation protein